jgi:hemolysin activation/secretion protein
MKDQAKEKKTKKEIPEKNKTAATGQKTAAPVKKTTQPAVKLQDIEILADLSDLRPWEKQALFRAAGWAPGKHVTAADFHAALARFQKRQMGTGRI